MYRFKFYGFSFGFLAEGLFYPECVTRSYPRKKAAQCVAVFQQLDLGAGGGDY